LGKGKRHKAGRFQRREEGSNRTEDKKIRVKGGKGGDVK